MPVTIKYYSSSRKEFRQKHGAEFADYINEPGNAQLGALVFDEAHVMNGIHESHASEKDPQKEPHATVQLSNQALRDQGACIQETQVYINGCAVFTHNYHGNSSSQHKATNQYIK
ncbi:hypothetical protein LMH87_005639 [Akanthomyces muscarius]|uniref:Uncharacterized protein n=1 Tax=Akanthomyces muscarius TaxID=2231603 RepID=A0A9W8UPH3_AKAMU|nr:hypothetical protein LMH87_005639 [Akanthomyces muscarius]KAJ4163942.1 hypothetical protein LMH87_005639 [Akanthomyces muscarius]